MKTMNFTSRDMEAFRSDAEGHAGISFTVPQIKKILNANPNGYTEKLWNDFEDMGHPGDYGMDTVPRDIWLSAIAWYFTGRDWPIYGDGKGAMADFCKVLDKKLDEEGIKHTHEIT